MTSKIINNARQLAMDFRQFKEQHRHLTRWLAFFVLLAYGVRIIHDNIFLDSEIVVLRPGFMHQWWIGLNRFGLTLSSRLFGMSRLIPYVSSFLGAVMLWASAVLLSFAAYEWCGRSRRYKAFLYLFPALFVTSPVFAEQYIFVLQAFEVSFAIFLCILAAVCAGKVVYHKDRLWLFPGIPLMVWTFGSYQSMVPLYVCLVLVSFLLFYMNQDANHALAQGLTHMAICFAGLALYQIVSVFVKSVLDIDSAYISTLIRWRTQDWRSCLSWIWMDTKNILLGKIPPFTAGSIFPPCAFSLYRPCGTGGKRRQTASTISGFWWPGASF